MHGSQLEEMDYLSIMDNFLKLITDIFNNREIAIGIWLAIFATTLLAHANTRTSMLHLLKALFHPRLIVFFGTVAVAVTLVCIILAQFGLWAKGQLPSTILWFVFSGSVMAGRGLQAQEDGGYFRGLFHNSFRLLGLFEFIVVARSFSIVTELILVPVLVFSGALIAFAERDPEHAKVKTFIEWIVVGIVIALLWNSISQIWSEPSLFLTTATGLNFLLPIFLTIGCIPVFYALYSYSHIESARIQFDLNTFQPDSLKRYAQKQFFRVFRLRPWLLRRATRQFQNLPAKTKADVDQIVYSILNYERASEAPPEINLLKGWSPFLARDFLKDHGLRTNDYHKENDEYWASAGYIDLDDHILPNSATFYIEGEDGIVNTLKLTGKFRDEFDGKAAHIKLRDIARSLCRNALVDAEIDFETLLPDKDAFEATQTANDTAIKAWGVIYPSGRGYEVFFTLSRPA